MPYIGKQPTVGNFQVCDAISVVDGQAAYTMQVGGSNVEPENANHMLVSLNGILQKPGSSFTISGSTITFASNLATGDVIDFITLLGDTLNTGAPSDDTVTAAKLNNDVISGQTALTAEPDDTDEFLVSDAGTIKRIDYSLIKGGGITEYDMHRLTSDFQGTTVITSNLERCDTSFEKIGTGMSESSGIFTFPSTGKYEVRFVFTGKNSQSSGERNHVGSIQLTTNNSDYSNVASSSNNIGYHSSSSNNWQTTSMHAFLDITDTSNMKVRFQVEANGNSNTYTQSSTTNNITYMTFIKIGDT